MKNTNRLGFILCLSLLFSLSGWSQFQQFNLGIQGPNGEPVPIAGIPGDGPVPRPEQPFDFILRFNDIFELARLENAILNRQRAVVDEWFRAQEGTFLSEINRQLGTNHTNFRNAQKDYFKNFEEYFRGLKSEASRLARRRFDLADQQEIEQLTYSGELYFIDDFKGDLRAHLDCNFDFGGICDFIGHRTEVVQGTRLADVSNFNVLNDLEDLALEDFARTEYEPALNRRCAIGLNTIRNNGFLANHFADAHISNYNRKDLRNKVFLMTAYLNITASNIRPPFALPIQRVEIPQSFWDSSTLLELGKDNGPFEGEEAKVFLDGYIAWRVNIAINLGSQEGPEAVFNRLNAIRDSVIAEHIAEAEKREQDRIERESALNLNDPCGNKDLQNKKVTSQVQSLIDRRTRLVEVGHPSIPTSTLETRQEFSIQDIESGRGDINLDRYELNITKLPNGFTAEGLFNHIRLNFSNFATGDPEIIFGAGEVIFEAYSDEDEQVWRSNNPLGAAMDFRTLGDTATVITSEFDNEELFWTFTTVFSLDHFGHPVSGHRQFGLAKNANGSFTFYLRGADRLATPLMQIVNNVAPSDNGEAAFELAGKSWEILMLNLEKFIRDRNGETIKFDRTKEYGRRHQYTEGRCN